MSPHRFRLLALGASRSMQMPDDATLVQLALAGRHEAFGELLLRHLPGVARLCVRLLGSTPDAQDVAQEASLQAFLGLRRLRDPARFGPWLHAIAANLARMELRRRRSLSLDALGDAAAPLIIWPPELPTPEQVHEARELHDAIVAELAALPPASREAAIGFFLEGYSYAELAALLGVPVGTLKGRLFKGRARLRQRLAATGAVPAPDRRVRKELEMSEQELVEVEIVEVFGDPVTQHRRVVLREKGAGRSLTIWIGPFEADAIGLALAGQQPMRPMTHDLALALLAPLGARVRRVTVNKLVEQTFFAEIELLAGDQAHTVDARPSDALALAVRTGAPVFVASAVLSVAGAEQAADEPAREPPPALVAQTIAYLSALIVGEATPGHGADLTSVDWQTRDVTWDEEALVAVRLPDAAPAWLLLPPVAWAQLTEMAEAVAAELRRARGAATSGAEPAEEGPEGG